MRLDSEGAKFNSDKHKHSITRLKRACMKIASPIYRNQLSAATFISAMNRDSPKPTLYTCKGYPMGCLANTKLTGTILTSRHHRCHYLEGPSEDLANLVDQLSRCQCLRDPLMLSIRPILSREFPDLLYAGFDQAHRQSIRSLSWLILKLDHGLDSGVSSPISVLRRFWRCEI